MQTEMLSGVRGRLSDLHPSLVPRTPALPIESRGEESVAPLARRDLSAGVDLGLSLPEDAAQQALCLVTLLAFDLDAVKHDDARARAHDTPAIRQSSDVRLVWEIAPELGIQLAPDDLVLSTLPPHRCLCRLRG